MRAAEGVVFSRVGLSWGLCPARWPAVLIVLALVGISLAQPAVAGAEQQPLVVLADHVDVADQNPGQGRFFSYTDFFPDTITVHQGDTVDFQTEAGAAHGIALASNESQARNAYPAVLNDSDDPLAPSGFPKKYSGSGAFTTVGGSLSGGGTTYYAGGNFFAPPVCGVPSLGESPCTFSGGSDVEIAGHNFGFDPLTGKTWTPDWLVKINAPPGTYTFYCTIHAYMHGTLTVVSPNKPIDTQASLDTRAQAEFTQDRQEALATESVLNHQQSTTDNSGRTTYYKAMGASTPDGLVELEEVLPNKPLTIQLGDSVAFVRPDIEGLHGVQFTNQSSSPISAFGFDCNGVFTNPPRPAGCTDGTDPIENASTMADPGITPSGAVLTSPATLLDSGLMFANTSINAPPNPLSWTVTTQAATTQPGTYNFRDPLLPYMTQTITVNPTR
jgi:plastocyanin